MAKPLQVAYSIEILCCEADLNLTFPFGKSEAYHSGLTLIPTFMLDLRYFTSGGILRGESTISNWHWQLLTQMTYVDQSNPAANQGKIKTTQSGLSMVFEIDHIPQSGSRSEEDRCISTGILASHRCYFLVLAVEGTKIDHFLILRGPAFYTNRRSIVAVQVRDASAYPTMDLVPRCLFPPPPQRRKA